MDKLKIALEEIKGDCVDAYVRHNLFGDQYVRIERFIPIVCDGAGFKYQDREIYIKDYLIKEYKIIKNKIIISGIGRSIEIIKIS